MTPPHLPPPARWRAAQREAGRRGAWIDMTMDGVFHVYDKRGEVYAGTWAGVQRYLEGTTTMHDMLNQIITGDARELAKQIPDESIDLIFTDPVYDRIEDYAWLAETAMRVLKPEGHLLAWQAVKQVANTLPVMTPPLYYRWTLVMTRSNVVQASYNAWLYSHWTPCFWFSAQPNSRPVERFRDAIDDPFVINPNVNHKWAKPIKTISAWLRSFTKPDAVVFDPFTGGGTVPTVCKMLCRNYVAFEIDPEIADKARQRLADTQSMHPVLLEAQQAMDFDDRAA